MWVKSAAILCVMGLLAACGKDRQVTRGAALYAQHCVICHGADLRGGGGVGVVGLNRIPADLTVLAQQADGQFPRVYVLEVLANYEAGAQPGRLMRPFVHLGADDRRRVRTAAGRTRVPAPQADLLAYLEARQLP